MPDPAFVTISECFARDGLQHEPDFVPSETKIALIDRFAACGFPRIEATSYSNPKVVPQFADASQVLRAIARPPGTMHKATCANPRAVERANADFDAGFGASEISFLVSASESHSQKNLRAARDGQWANVAEMRRAAGERYRIIGSISVAFGCPFEGFVDPATVLADCARFLELGVRHVSLGDTTGVATPASVAAMIRRIRSELPAIEPIAHFHDTRGTGLANCVAAYDSGCRWFDSSFGGVGGHPAKIAYGGGHTGNVATEDLVNLFAAMGVPTGLDLERVMAAALECEKALGRELHGRTTRAGFSPQSNKATAQ